MSKSQTDDTMSVSLPIRTQHCRFCSHLLLATTRDLAHLPRRSDAALDQALILPLDQDSVDPETEIETETETETETQHRKHTTLLLSTTVPDRQPTLIRRDDGIEKRLLLRCGRCRVVMGYYLNRVHYSTKMETDTPPAVYVLPAALVETEYMGEGGLEGEWRQWMKSR